MDARILARFADTLFAFEDPMEDIRGRRLLDPHGVEIGMVEDLILDSRTGEVRLLEIRNGGFLGFGGTRFLVMADDVERITPRTVHLDHPGARGRHGAYAPVLRELPPEEHIQPPIL